MMETRIITAFPNHVLPAATVAMNDKRRNRVRVRAVLDQRRRDEYQQNQADRDDEATLTTTKAARNDNEKKETITATIEFEITAKVRVGQEVRICGNEEGLGSWEVRDGLRLKWTDRDRWRGRCEIEKTEFESAVEFKAVICNDRDSDCGRESDDECAWEEGRNRVIELSSFDVECVDGKLQFKERLIVRGMFGVDDDFEGRMNLETTVGMKNETEEGRVEAIGIAERSQECAVQFDERGSGEGGDDNKREVEDGMSSSSSNSGGSNSIDSTSILLLDKENEENETADSNIIINDNKADVSIKLREFTPSITHVATLDKERNKWFMKLASVKGIVGFEVPELTNEKLATAATYLRWISSGTVPCAHPPNLDGSKNENTEEYNEKRRAAIEARSIFASIEKVEGETYQFGQKLTKSEASLVRHINPWLPSFDARFAPNAPLTKIRDLCNKGNKLKQPKWLIDEMTEKIEGCLMKNFDIDALTSTRRVLDNVRRFNDNNKEGSTTEMILDEDFVADLDAFYLDLKSFLGGGYVFECLDDLRDRLDDENEIMQNVATLYSSHFAAQSARIRSSFSTGVSKRTYDDDDEEEVNEEKKGVNENRGWFSEEGEQTVNALRAATRIRAHFCSGLVTGLRNDAPDEAINERHRWRQCETALEQYAFLRFAAIEKMARTSNIYADVLSSKKLNDKNIDVQWQRMSEIISIGLRHVGMSGYERRECEIVAAELETWCGVKSKVLSARNRVNKSEPPTESVESLRRLRASLLRARRVVDGKLKSIVEGYAFVPEVLASALGLPENVGEDHVEFAIREDVSFQLMLLLRACGNAIDNAIADESREQKYEIVSATSSNDITNKSDLCRVIIVEDGLAFNEASLERAILTKRTDTENLFVVVRKDETTQLKETDFVLSEAFANRVKCIAFVSSEVNDVLFTDKLMLKAMKTSIMMASNNAMKYSIALTDDQKEISKLMKLAKSGKCAFVSMSSAKGLQVSTYDKKVKNNSILQQQQQQEEEDYKRVDENSIQWETGDGLYVALDEATRETCGKNATSFRMLKKRSLARGVVIPFGVCDTFNKETSLSALIKRIDSYKEIISNADDEMKVDEICLEIREIIRNNPLPEKFISNMLRHMQHDENDGEKLIAITASASSNNDVDDDLLVISNLKSYCEADNLPGISNVISEIWASLWTLEAVKRRSMHGIEHSSSSIAVVLRRANHFERSFVVSMRENNNKFKRDITKSSIDEIRVCVGLFDDARKRFDEDEWKMRLKNNNEVETLTFSNISEASRSRKTAPWFGKITSERITYSEEPLSASKNERNAICQSICEAVKDAVLEQQQQIKEVRGGFESGRVVITSLKFF